MAELIAPLRRLGAELVKEVAKLIGGTAGMPALPAQAVSPQAVWM
ncbi:MAG TPA: hypothetical protein VFM54_20150 [Micromonosporaceae bacterium]|nr:hypothetical protein [Micromonosporaceae bacterium]